MFSLAVFYFPKFDPIIFRLGPLAVHWYGVAYLAGFFCAYLLLQRMANRGWLRMDPKLVGDFVTWAAFGVFLGGRLGWWLFYHRASQGPEPWYEPIAVWHGGMSFHGGLVGVTIATLLFARMRKLSFANIADAVTLVAPIGLFFGRIANFINHELYGSRTTLPWGVIFPTPDSPPYPNYVYESFARHPSQLYEAILEGPVLLGLLWLVFRKRRPRDGGIALLFVILYSVFRFSVEFVRLPDVQLGYLAFGWLTMGQILSAAIAIAGTALWLTLYRKSPVMIVPPKPVAKEEPAAKKPDVVHQGAAMRRRRG